MAKVTIDDIKECKWKEKEEKSSKKAAKTFIVVEWTIPRSIEKQTRATFIQAWSLITIRDVGDQFHKISQQRYELAHMGINVSTLAPLPKL